MEPEFLALGVDRRRRGAIADRTLDFLRRCFDAADDVVEENGQPFFFRPRPLRPRILVGGAGPHALARAVRYGDGWMPMGADPEKLAPAIEKLRALARDAGKETPEVACMGGLPPSPPDAAARLRELRDLGVTRFLTGARYGTDAEPFRRAVDGLVAARKALGD
jgi:alkanesulfonate monooxygenase SsuD/methylene tetrahydromethanopterin reductase-like flavin-dependent oxidoreductase (luciferase family)